jgi:hypothetical protein
MQHFITRVLLITAIVSGIAVSGCRAGETSVTNTTSAPRITEHGVGPDYAGYCLTCHGPGNGPQEFPPDHAGRTNDMCLTCHHS